MHPIVKLIREVNKTHKGLGEMVAMNLIAAKSKRCILNIAAAGTGKSTATNTSAYLLKDRATRYTSLTMAGLVRLKDEFTGFTGHIIIDDLGAEKSLWTRSSTVSAIAHLVMEHHVKRITQTQVIEITDFNGSASLNIQPVMMGSIVQDDDWIAVIRDKVIRQYHLIRPTAPCKGFPTVKFDWGINIQSVAEPNRKCQEWYQLVAIALSQWSYGRCLIHIPELLKAIAAIDNRKKCKKDDYIVLAKLMKPMQLERFILESFGFESGRNFSNNIYCLLIELASWGEPTIDTIAEDYKVHPRTVLQLAATASDWCFISPDEPKRLIPTEQTKKIFERIGVNQQW